MGGGGGGGGEKKEEEEGRKSRRITILVNRGQVGNGRDKKDEKVRFCEDEAVIRS